MTFAAPRLRWLTVETCYSRKHITAIPLTAAPLGQIPRQRAGHEKAPTQGRGSSVEETRNQWAQPPALAGAPSVLKDDPQAQLLTAFGLLMAKPEPMSEST